MALSFVISIGSSLTMVSCDDIIDTIADCVINRHPKLTDQNLEVGYLEEYYYAEIKGSIINEPYDDDYYYSFKVKGQLPNGIESWVDGRKLIFAGKPLQIGTYNIKIDLHATPYYDEGGLCDNSTSQDYTLIVIEQ